MYTYRPKKGGGVTDLVFKLFGNFPGEGLTAKVAIGSGALVDGLLQVQLSGIVQETEWDNCHTEIRTFSQTQLTSLMLTVQDQTLETREQIPQRWLGNRQTERRRLGRPWGSHFTWQWHPGAGRSSSSRSPAAPSRSSGRFHSGRWRWTRGEPLQWHKTPEETGKLLQLSYSFTITHNRK